MAQLLSKLNRLLKRFSYQRFLTAKWNAKTKKWFPEQKHIIDYAFEIAGVPYFQFNDIFTLPYERGLLAIAFYEETRMKCSREYLLEHVRVLRDLLRENKIDVFKINELNEQMSQRLHMGFDVDLLYKLASVVFFDKRENPALYDAEYNLQKIAFWKQHKGVKDFFLQMPVQRLIPFLQNSDFDLETYSRLNADLNKVHSERLQALNFKKR